MKLRSWSFKYMIVLAVIYSLFIAGSLVYNIVQLREHTTEKALAETRTLFDLNLAYRRWCAGHGGVYVPITDTYKPNPYLIHPKREINASDGSILTLVNPAMMTRSVHSILSLSSDHPIINKVTSLKYINPENRPDEWENRSLESFEAGAVEASEVVEVKGVPYMRLLRPYMVEKGCLDCHGWQGYKIGDVRGGLSVGIPLEPFMKDEYVQRRNAIAAHLLIWISGITGLVFFSSRLRRSEEQTSESEWKFRTLAEAASDWEYWLDEKRNLVFMSPSSENLTGYRPDEFSADPSLLLGVIHPDDRELYRNHLGSLSDPAHEELNIRIVAKNGRIKWLSHICSPMYSGSKFVGRREINRDITDKKALEAQLLQSQKMEALGLLAGGIAHDFNNILTVIMGYSSMLQDLEDLESEEARRYIHIIFEASEKAHGLTSSLLAFSRKQEINPVLVDIKDMIKGMTLLLKSIMGDDIELKVSHISEKTMVFADPGQLQQVFMNLATNARDAMKSTGVFSIETDYIKVDSDHARLYDAFPGDYVMISISDTGVGMDKEVLPRIFEPFFTTKEKGKGTGLGLAIIYGIIKQQNGFINVFSEKNMGTTFRIYLPFTEKGTGFSSGAAIKDAVSVCGKESVLVVEDDMLMREFLGEALSKYGYKVFFAEDGDAALNVFAEHKDEISLLLIDMVLPRKNGMEVFESVRENSPDIPALFMSGYSRDVLVAKGLYRDGLEYLTKPVIVHDLLTRIRASIDGRRND